MKMSILPSPVRHSTGGFWSGQLGKKMKQKHSNWKGTYKVISVGRLHDLTNSKLEKTTTQTYIQSK